jgi:predicted nucleic acid-binding protein
VEQYVLDASALLAYFGFEPRHAAPTVARFLSSASDQESRVSMSRVNWGEFYYVVLRERGLQAAEDALRLIDQLPIQVVDPDREITKAAANLKASHGLGYADSFAAALAHNSRAKLVTADRDFSKVAALIEIVWLL